MTEDKHQILKWATFTYNTKQVRNITKLFRDTHIRVAFRTCNTIENILKHKPKTDIYCTAMSVLVGDLQTQPLNLSHSLFPTSPSVLQSLC
jgi:hypothetical protein